MSEENESGLSSHVGLVSSTLMLLDGVASQSVTTEDVGHLKRVTVVMNSLGTTDNE